MYSNKNIRPDNVKYIAIHCTGTLANISVRAMDKLPYHFLITRSGRLISLNPVSATDGTVEIAWLGGVTKDGRHVDNRTEEQKSTLFNTLLILIDKFEGPEIVGAGELYPYGFPNPGFDLKTWLNDYIPVFLQDAA